MIRDVFANVLVLPATLALHGLAAQQPAGYDPQRACAALCAKADRGELAVPLVLSVLGSARESEARTVAAIVRHEWRTLPDELFDGLDLDARAGHRLLAELALAPRPAAQRWVRSQTKPRAGRSYDHRLLALAACGEPFTRDEAKLVVKSLAHERPSDGFYRACSRLAPQLADRLVGRVHALLMKGDVAVTSLKPLLERLSGRGTKSLLGLAMTLPQSSAYQLLRQVIDARPEQAYERVDAALDGRVPLDPSWLAFAAARIDRPERVARVLAVLREAPDAADRELAFEALLAAKAIDAEVLKVATDGDSTARIRRVIARAAPAIPAEYVVRWLYSTPEVVMEMARALVRRPQLEEAVQRSALQLLGEVEVASGGTPLHLLTAIAHRGDGEALARVWPLLVESDAWRDLLERLGRRDEPYVKDLLGAEFRRMRARAVADHERERHQEQLDWLRLQLFALGDRSELAPLVANAPSRDAAFVRRCRRCVDQMSATQAAALIDAALVSEDPEHAGELLEWAASAQPGTAADRLWALWQQPPSEAPLLEDLNEVVARLLMSTGRGQELRAQLRAALPRGPLDGAIESLPYEVLNGMPEPLTPADLRLCAELLLWSPMGDPAGEQRQVRRWPDGSFGFPLVRAIASRLRAVDEAEVAAVFAEVVAEVREQPKRRSISRQRLKVFWRALSLQPALQRTLGRVTARLWPETAADAAVSDGGALWLQAADAEQRGDFIAAERLYRAAGRALLRSPSGRAEARWLLGDRDPAEGIDPVAALAAAPYRAGLLAARVAGDDAAAADAAAMVREFSGHDAAARATVSGNNEDSGR